jgi:hypothetical protein
MKLLKLCLEPILLMGESDKKVLGSLETGVGNLIALGEFVVLLKELGVVAGIGVPL